MAPDEHGITDCSFKSLCKGNKLVVVARAACDQILAHAVRAHQAPLVVIGSEPELCDVLKPYVVPYFARNDMAVIVNDRLLLCVFMIKLFCKL